MAPQISIVGGGIVGLVLGQCLRRKQIPAIIWEKSKQFPASSLQNFGITLYPSVYQALLQHLDLDERAWYDESAIRSERASYSPGEPIRVNRSALIQSLSHGLDVRWEHKLKTIEKGKAAHPHRLELEHDGKNVTEEADLVIVADGVHSAARTSLHLNSFKLEVLPYVVYNGKRRFKHESMPPGLDAVLDSPDGLTLRHGSSVLKITSGYNDSKSGEIAINYTLSRPATSRDSDLLGRTKSEAETLAERFIGEVDALPPLKEPFHTVFSTEKMRGDRLLHWLMRIALVDALEAQSLADSGIVLLGDAAHPQPILGGAGANAAIMDALAIADAINPESETCCSSAYQQLQLKWKALQADARQGIESMHQTTAHAAI